MKILLSLIVAVYLSLNAVFASERNYLSEEYPIYENSFSHFPDSDPQKKSLKIVSFNIKFSKNISAVISELTKNEQLKDADIILLQEVVGVPGDAHDHAAEVIAQAMKMNYAYAPAFIHQYNELDFGVAILSKYPLSNIKKLILPHLDFVKKTQRIAIAATINLHGKELRLYSAHLEAIQFSSQRIDQMDTIIADSFSRDNEYILIGGDLNSAPFWQRLKLVKHVKKNGFFDSTKGIGITFKKGPIRFKLDHIFTKGLNLVKAGKGLFTKASDHRPIWIVAKIRD